MSKNTNLSFLTDYITADITNGRIGINNASPAYAFDVTGLERSRGTTASDTAPLGSELAGVTGTGTNWALAGGATNLNVGGYTHTVGSTIALTTALAAVAGTYYQITYTITGRTAGSITIAYGGTSTSASASGNTGPLASSTSVLTITPTTDFDGTVVLSIKLIGASSASSTFANSAGTSNIELRAISDISSTFIGYNAGKRTTTGLYNTFIGNGGLNNTTGSSNTGVGQGALNVNNIGNNNSALGAGSGASNTTGGSNSFFGWNSGYFNTTGASNTFVGASAGQSNTTGSFNISVGQIALQNNTSGSSNIALGQQAGRYISDGATGNSITNTSIYIGTNTKALANNQSNQIVIGDSATGLGSNTTVLGNSSTVTTAIYGNLLLGGTTDAGYKLDVTGIARTSTSTYLATASGSVGIGTTSPDALLTVAGANQATGAAFNTYGNVLIYSTDSQAINKGGSISFGGKYTTSGTPIATFARIHGKKENTIVDGTAGYLSFETTADATAYLSEKMRITSVGNVGIGTTSPFSTNGTNLEITSTSAFASRLILTNTTASGHQYFFQNQADGNLIIYDNTAASERMRITSAGYVGIGTSSPGYPLTVNGTVGAGNFLSSTAVPTIQINTWTTFYTMPAEVGIFSVIIGLGTNDMATWYAYGTVFCNGASGVFLSSFNSTLVSLRTSGLNIQVLLGAGAGFARELPYKVLRT